MRHEGLDFDRYVANYYVRKISQCRERGIEFKLSLTQVRNMLRAKRCQLTGVYLTHRNAGGYTENARATDVTIDRLDCSKPYEKGNVLAVAHYANQLKSSVENKGFTSVKAIHLMSYNLKKRGIL